MHSDNTFFVPAKMIRKHAKLRIECNGRGVVGLDRTVLSSAEIEHQLTPGRNLERHETRRDAKQKGIK